MTNSTIKLGLMPPLTGLVGIYGTEIARAGQIACMEVNEGGGVLGRPLELVIEDDASLPDSAVAAAGKLVDDHGCVAMIGNLLSNSRIAVAYRVAEPRKIPYLNFSFYEGSILSRYFFHFAALPNQQIDRMIPFMRQKYGPRMFFAGNNYEWPRGSIDAAKRALQRCAGTVVGEHYCPIGVDADGIERLLDQVEANAPDVFVPYFAGVDQVNLLTRFTARGLKQRMAVVMGHYDEIMASKLPPVVRAGFYSSNTYFMSVEGEENQKYLARLAQHEGVSGVWPQGNGILTNFGEGAYLCVKAFAQAANQAGSVEAESLVDVLKTIRVLGPQGSVQMDPVTHHAEVNTYLSRCQSDGSFAIVERFGAIAPALPERYKHQRISAKATMEDDVRLQARMLEQLSEAVFLVNAVDSSILYVNAGTTKMLGYVGTELIGAPLSRLDAEASRESSKTYASVILLLPHEGSWQGELKTLHKSGGLIWCSVSISAFTHPTYGEVWLCVATDITERKRAQDRIHELAFYDPLTGLPNRALLLDRLKQTMAASSRSGHYAALMLVDIDNFKVLNDTLGHDMGDLLLKQIAQRLSQCVREEDTVARLGGDEYVLMLANLGANKTEAAASTEVVAEKILEALNQPYRFGDTPYRSSASIGVTVFLSHQISVDDLMKQTELAMYRSKASGRNTLRFFDPAMEWEVKQRAALEDDLRRAFDAGQLLLHYQAQVTHDGRVTGAEVLTRWQHPERGMVSPAEFIPLAEETGLVVPLGRWVLESVCAQLAKWAAQPQMAHLNVAVNVSVHQFQQADFVDQVLEVLKRTGANPQRLKLELTESMFANNVQEIIEKMFMLKAKGVGFSLDDFGTGYSSLSYLRRLPLDQLKIDQSFVRDVLSDQNAAVIAKTIVTLAHSLDLGVIAEGVETAAQRDFLAGSGCYAYQGYFFGRPAPVEEFEALVQGIDPVGVGA